MKTNEEIKDAYFQIMNQAAQQYSTIGRMEETTRQRLTKGYKWMVENGYYDELNQFADDYSYEYFLAPIRNEYFGIVEKTKKKTVRDYMAAYELENDVRFNYLTKEYEKI